MSDGKWTSEKKALDDFADDISGMPLDLFLLDPGFAEHDTVELIHTFAVAKISKLAAEVFSHPALVGPGERGFMAEMVLSVFVKTALDCGGNSHQLAAALRRLAKTL